MDPTKVKSGINHRLGPLGAKLAIDDVTYVFSCNITNIVKLYICTVASALGDDA